MLVDSLPYREAFVDVSAALARAQIDPAGCAIKGVEVRSLPAATSPAYLHFSLRGDRVRIREGSTIEVPGEALGAGVFLSCAAGGAAAVAEFVFLYDDADHNGPVFRVRDP